MRFFKPIPRTMLSRFGIPLACLLMLATIHPAAFTQSPNAERRADEALSETPTPESSETTFASVAAPEIVTPSVLELVIQGGWMMVPIALMSIIVIAFSIERGLGLRQANIFPEEMVAQLGVFAASSARFDPRKVYRLCQGYPSSASTIIRTMLLKLGRPQSEVESAVAEASQREADKLYSNVRTLNLAAAVTPLMGLLGTVWGMILSFHSTANLPVGSNKAEALAGGIYVALVTTFAGLAVAIPAAVLAHWFEGRIRSRLMQVDELMTILLPHIERYEGKLRVSKQQLDDTDGQVIARDDKSNQNKRSPAAAK